MPEVADHVGGWGETRPPSPPAPVRVSLSQVTVRLHRHPVLNDVSARLAPGLTTVLGPNGAGKTTLLRLLATVLTPDSGTIDWGGQTGLDLRSRLGYLPQAFRYPPSFTAMDLVAYVGWCRGMDYNDARAAASAALARVDLQAVASTRMRRLSGGMVRRVGIAQALVNTPDLLILDEPTVGLDPGQRRSFRELLRELSTSSTVVMSTHLVEDVADLGGRVVVLSEGSVRADEPLDSLIADVSGGGVRERIESRYQQLMGT